MFDKFWLCLILDNNWTALSLYTSADGYVGLYVLMGAPVFENKWISAVKGIGNISRHYKA